MCLCDYEFPRDTAFIFLDDVSNILFDKFTEAEIRREKAYSKVFTSGLCPILKERMAYYKSNPDVNDSLKELKKNVIQFKDEVLMAHELLMQREEKIALIVRRAESLKAVSGVYYNNVSLSMLIQ